MRKAKKTIQYIQYGIKYVKGNLSSHYLEQLLEKEMSRVIVKYERKVNSADSSEISNEINRRIKCFRVYFNVVCHVCFFLLSGDTFLICVQIFIKIQFQVDWMDWWYFFLIGKPTKINSRHEIVFFDLLKSAIKKILNWNHFEIQLSRSFTI